MTAAMDMSAGPARELGQELSGNWSTGAVRGPEADWGGWALGGRPRWWSSALWRVRWMIILVTASMIRWAGMAEIRGMGHGRKHW